MILVCGEALIDLFAGPLQGGQMPARAIAGGSPFNVAVGLARLGVEVALLGGLSRDRFGAVLAEILAREGVDGRYLIRTDRPSTLSVVATDEHGQPQYVFYGDTAADRSVTRADLPAGLPDSVRALTFGSYTMAVDPVGSAFAALAEREAGRRVISVDPNLRPSVVGDVGRWSQAAERFFRRATIVKASDEDVRLAWQGRVSVAEAAAGWLAAGARLVVVTEGARGATAFGAAGTVSVPARRVAVVDTVGAGDSVHAALLARLAQTDRLSVDAIAGLDLAAMRDLLGTAMDAASITVSRTGANLPTAADLAAIRPG